MIDILQVTMNDSLALLGLGDEFFLALKSLRMIHREPLSAFTQGNDPVVKLTITILLHKAVTMSRVCH